MTRLEKILNDCFYLECLENIELREENRQFCRHNLQHFLDVARLAYIFHLENGQIDKIRDESDLSIRSAREVVYAAGLLHDIGRWREYETGEDHAAVSAELAVEILARAGFNQNEIGLITSGISEHRRNANGMSVLGQNLYKADKLSRQCYQCLAGIQCYKLAEMELIRKGLFY